MAKQRDLEERLERMEKQLGVFQKISRLMVREMPLQDVLQGIVDLIVEFTACDSCLLYLMEDKELVLCASNTPHPFGDRQGAAEVERGPDGMGGARAELVAISREAFKDPRFKFFGDLPEDTYESFLSAPVIARNRVVGVINVQHRMPHRHWGDEMEVITTVGEQVGCLLVLARMSPTAIEEANHVELVLSHGQIAPRAGEVL